MSGTALSSAPHYVYRLYDADERLLYIGCSRNVASRLRSHRRSQPWGHEIARHEVDGPFKFLRAIAREASQIRELRPLHNIVHNTTPSAVSA